MQSKLLHEVDGKRTFAVILQKGDEAMRCLQDFALKEGLGASQVTAIGALSSAKLAFFDWESKQYRPIPVRGAGRSRFFGRRYRGRPGRQTKAYMCMRCWDGAMGPPWPRICRRVTSGRRSRSSSRNRRRIFAR